jgi:hypothetical protein
MDAQSSKSPEAVDSRGHNEREGEMCAMTGNFCLMICLREKTTFFPSIVQLLFFYTHKILLTFTLKIAVIQGNEIFCITGIIPDPVPRPWEGQATGVITSASVSAPTYRFQFDPHNLKPITIHCPHPVRQIKSPK